MQGVHWPPARSIAGPILQYSAAPAGLRPTILQYSMAPGRPLAGNTPYSVAPTAPYSNTPYSIFSNKKVAFFARLPQAKSNHRRKAPHIRAPQATKSLNTPYSILQYSNTPMPPAEANTPYSMRSRGAEYSNTPILRGVLYSMQGVHFCILGWSFSRWTFFQMSAVSLRPTCS